MNPTRSSLIALAVLSIIAYFLTRNTDKIDSPENREIVLSEEIVAEETEHFVKMDKRDRMDLAMAQEFHRTKDPKLGTVPRERLYQAYRYANERRANKTLNPIAGVSWSERGPDNVGGRTRAIMVDPNDGTNASIFAAGVSGGLWKTTDITAATPVWTAVDDFFENLAVTTIAYDPSNTMTMYLGTGEGWYNLDAVRGDGLFKSTDGGANWSQLAATTGSTFNFVQKVMVHPTTGDVYAATRDGGIQRSTNGGTSWAAVLNTGSGSGTNRAADIEFGADDSIYVSMGIFNTDGVYKSGNGNSGNWTKLNTGLNGFPVDGFERIELATAPANANVIYAFAQDTASGNPIGNIYRSGNAGTTWSTVANPTDDDPGIGSDYTRGQAWYNLIAAVDPNDITGNTIYTGGIDLFKSITGGATWSQISHWTGNFGHQYVHADQHAIIFQPGSSNVIYFGNDGGIYRTTNGSAVTPTISERNTSYNVTQFYACAIHPTAGENHFLAGSQDNGSHLFQSGGINSTTEVTGGDGAFCHIDQDEPTYQYTQFVYCQFRRSTDGGNSFSSINVSASAGFFINPSDYDNTNDQYYAAFNAGQYLRWNDPQTGTSFTSVSISAFNSLRASAITVSPNTANRVFFGTEGGRVVQVDNADGSGSITSSHLNSGAGMPSGTVSCIEVEDGDDNHLLVTYSNYGVSSVWETTDGGSTWTNVEGNLPDMPVRWALFNPLNSDQAMLATELGVWSTDNLDGGSTAWDPSNSGLANVRVDMLQRRSSDNIVIAATHGRGLYSSDVFAQPAAGFSADNTLSYILADITFSDESVQATSWSWNFGDGNTSTSQNPVHSYAAAGTYTVSLTINSGADVETKTDYITILPNRGTPYLAADGGDFESNAGDFAPQATSGSVNIWERGAPSNAITTLNSPTNGWKTDLDADVTVGTYTCVLQSPSFNMTASGSYTLRFRKSMEVIFSNAPFGVYVEYSSDHGSTWTRLGVDNDLNGTNWYERGPSSATSHSVTPGGYAFCSNFTNQYTDYDISFLAGNSQVCFRFVFMIETGWTASGYLADGFMVDDFEILGEDNDEVLPVSLSLFTAVAEPSRDRVRLNWRTESEVDNSHWIIERRDNGSPFRPITELPGQGTTPAASDYEYLDEQLIQGSTYTYRLLDVSLAGEVTRHPSLNVFMGDSSIVVNDYELMKNYPNPFNPSTNIGYRISDIRLVQLRIYDLLGRTVRTLVHEEQQPGVHSVIWDGLADDGQPVASGLYIYQLRTLDFVKSRKMMLLR